MPFYLFSRTQRWKTMRTGPKNAIGGLGGGCSPAVFPEAARAGRCQIGSCGQQTSIDSCSPVRSELSLDPAANLRWHTAPQPLKRLTDAACLSDKVPGFWAIVRGTGEGKASTNGCFRWVAAGGSRSRPAGFLYRLFLCGEDFADLLAWDRCRRRLRAVMTSNPLGGAGF